MRFAKLRGYHKKYEVTTEGARRCRCGHGDFQHYPMRYAIGGDCAVYGCDCVSGRYPYEWVKK